MDAQEFDRLAKRYDYHMENNYGTEKFYAVSDEFHYALEALRDAVRPELDRFLASTHSEPEIAGDDRTVPELRELVLEGESAIKTTPKAVRARSDAEWKLRDLKANLKKREAFHAKYGVDLPANTRYDSFYTTTYNRSGYASKRIRKWLKEQQIRVPARGHIPSPLIEHYIREHEDYWEIGEVWTSTPYHTHPMYGTGEVDTTREDSMQIGLWCFRCADTHARTSGIPTQRGWDVHQSPRTPGTCIYEFFYTGRGEYRIYDPRPIPEWERELRAKYIMS